MQLASRNCESPGMNMSTIIEVYLTALRMYMIMYVVQKQELCWCELTIAGCVFATIRGFWGRLSTSG